MRCDGDGVLASGGIRTSATSRASEHAGRRARSRKGAVRGDGAPRRGKEEERDDLMPLAKRIVPVWTSKGGRVVKGVKFEALRDAGDPVELAERYRDEGADEIVFLDITASLEKRATQSLSSGRWRRTLTSRSRSGAASVDERCKAGALQRRRQGRGQHRRPREPWSDQELADVFGSQCVVVAIDTRRTGPRPRGLQSRRYQAHWYHGSRLGEGSREAQGRASSL